MLFENMDSSILKNELMLLKELKSTIFFYKLSVWTRFKIYENDSI